MWSPLARQAAEVGRARRDELAATSRRGSAGPGCRRRASAAAPRATSRFMSSSVDRRRPVRQRRSSRRVAEPGAPVALARPRRRSRPAPRRSSARCGTKFWRITSWRWPCSACTAASASSAAIALVLGVSPMPDEDPARERDPQLAGGADRLQPPLRVLGRRALVGDEVGVDRLEHQPLRGGHLAQPREVVARRARRGSCAAAARARARARRPTRRRR